MLALLSRAAALACLLCLPLPAGGADAPSPDDGQTLDVRRPSPEQRRRLLAGDTIGYQVAETNETELGAGVAMYLPVPLARVAEALTSPDIVLKEPSITAWGPLASDATVAALAGYRLSAGEVAEAQDAFDAVAGGRLNLSAAEIEAFRAAKATLRGADRAAVAESGAAQWRALLLQRVQAFQARWLDGVAPYARRGGVTDPAAVLRVAAGDARIVAHLMPRLADALLRFPAEQSRTAISQFYWVKRQVQGRADPILIHHLVDVTPQLALYVERHVYVGHSYNASQILSGAVPYEDGVLVFSSNRVSTDQVAGLGGELKRAIGRRQLRGEIVKRFDRIRAALLKPAAPPERVESP
ncbi:MAG TPA: hypothetical protein VFX87_01710 [Methylomirabilota bacterium]|nr:hypothetical protein [Methylomirabilota bacterium]